MAPQDLNDLFYFAQVVDHGGFAPAGRALGIPKSKLSRRVAALESRLGVRLIQRTTRRFSVTDIGRTYYAHCKAVLVEAQAAQESIELTRAEPCGVVRITCPIALLDMQIAPLLAQFMAQYARVEIQAEATDRVVDVVGEGIDIAVRVRPPPLEDSELLLRTFAEAGQCLVASPQLLTSGGAPVSPADLRALPSLAHGQPQSDHHWDLYGPAGARATIAHHPRLITRGMIALRAAAIAGIGVVQLPEMLVHDELASGELRRVLPDWTPRREIIHAVFASRRGQLPSVRALLDFLAAALDSAERRI
ncbi:MAG: LysR family transcriptional regulator [Pseudomonadales bacterium]|nr:LysR family transcriptional regulator [Pseudomonadales bacterium]